MQPRSGLGWERVADHAFSTSEISSSDEESRKEPKSIRSLLKVCFKHATRTLTAEASNSVGAGIDVREDQALASMLSDLALDGESSLEVAVASGDSRLCDDLRKLSIRPTPAAAKRHSCRICGHEFSLARTLNLHQKICKAGTS